MNKNNQTQSIEEWDETLELLSSHFSLKYGRVVTKKGIFDALFLLVSDERNMEWAGDLIDENISYNESLNLLSTFNFDILTRTVYTEVNIIPLDLLITRKARIKDNGLIWLIHKYDKDPFPSSPHAHQVDDGIKLDLSNGKCYNIRKHVHTLNKKQLLDFRKKVEKVFDGDLPILAI